MTMLLIVHDTIVSWPPIWNIDHIIFRISVEKYGDVETMKRGLVGRLVFFINPPDTVGRNLSLYPLRQSIVRIGLRMLTPTFTYYINLHSLRTIVSIVHFGTWSTRWRHQRISTSSWGPCCEVRECQNYKWYGGFSTLTSTLHISFFSSPYFEVIDVPPTSFRHICRSQPC